MVSGFFGLMCFPLSYDWALLLVRLAVGLPLLCWGLKKISNLKKFTSGKDEPPKIFAVGPLSAKAGFICSMLVETGTALCLIFGFCTRLVVIACIFNMAVAFKVTKGPYLTSPAAIYLLMMIVFLIIGGGQYSLDYLLMKAI